MYSTLKRFLSAITSIAVAFTVTAVPVSAAALSNDSVSAAAGTITEVYVNPLYADVITESDLLSPSQAAGTSLLEDDVYCTTTAEAGEILRSAMKERTETVTVKYRAPVDNFPNDDAVRNVLTEICSQALVHTGRPDEGDYIMWQYAGWKGSISGFRQDGIYYMTATYTLTYYTSRDQEDEVDSAVSELAKEMNADNPTDYVKMCRIYDYICSHVTYDHANLTDDSYKLKYTAYAALINETAVCQGYATLFYRLALELGVDARIITGTGNGGPHAWNIAELDERYYNVDTTWGTSCDNRPYFLQCNDTFSNHTRGDEYSSEDFCAEYPMAAADYEPSASNTVASGTCGDNLTWTLDNAGTMTISGTGEMTSSEWQWDYKSSIKTVVIEEGVTSIRDSAFETCQSLESVTLPSSLKTIGTYAFNLCFSLSTIYIPEGVTSISYGAFAGCRSMTSIQVAENNPNYCSVDGVLFTKDKKQLCAFPAGKSTAYSVPDGVTRICKDAFGYCNTLESVILPESLQSIDKYAFWHCISLTTIDIPAGVTSISEEAFSQCSSLTAIRVAENNPSYCTVDGVLFTKDQKKLAAYPGGKKDASYTVPDGVTALENWAFRECTTLESVTLPDSLETIGECAFYGCSSLTSINIPDGVTNLGGAFFGCSALKSVTFPDSIETIESGTFAYCTALTAIDIPDSVTSIGDNAFFGCSALKTVTLSDSLKSIGHHAFADWSNTANATVVFAGNAPKMGEDVFYNTTVRAVYPAGNATWTADVMQNYGGTITWISSDKYTPSPSPAPTDTPTANSFPDVSKDDWFYEDTQYVSENNLMNGIPDAEGETCFEPDAPTSRAMVVTILYRMSGCPEVSEANNFSDVENDSWYTDAVIWASENGIVTGYAGTDQFGTNDPITREQMAVMMYRYAQYNGKDTTASASLDSFTDCEQVHSWAKDAFAWANAEGLIGGKPTDDGKFFLDPAGNAVRSQAAAILHRYCENI